MKNPKNPESKLEKRMLRISYQNGFLSSLNLYGLAILLDLAEI
jgi:hypothetical protein